MEKFGLRLMLGCAVALSWGEFVAAQDTCEAGFETVDVKIEQAQFKSYEIIPGRYEWVDGIVKGEALTYRVEQGDNASAETEPFVFAKFVPNEIKDGRTRVQIERPAWQEIIIPSEAKMVAVNRKLPCLKTASTRSGE